MNDPSPSPAPPRRGCGCGCLLTTPLALLLTGLALWLWLPQALRFAVFVVGGQEANPWPLAGATALIVGAQVLPRVLPALVVRVRSHALRLARPVGEQFGDHQIAEADHHQEPLKQWRSLREAQAADERAVASQIDDQSEAEKADASTTMIH